MTRDEAQAEALVALALRRDLQLAQAKTARSPAVRLRALDLAAKFETALSILREDTR